MHKVSFSDGKNFVLVDKKKKAKKHKIYECDYCHKTMSHVGDYIKLTGKSLGRVCDQIVEACHSALNKRLVSSGYHRKNLDSDTQGQFLYRGIIHFNSYNI